MENFCAIIDFKIIFFRNYDTANIALFFLETKQ